MAKKRNFRMEYKLYQSSRKRKRYRAELNKKNREAGTYGNHDHLDWAHHNGKITNLESEHKNRGTKGEGGRRKGVKHRRHY